MKRTTIRILCTLALSSLLIACGTGRPAPIIETSDDLEGLGNEVECTTSEECGTDYSCQDGTCVADETGCQSSEDCAVGLLCDLATAECVECLSDDQCGFGDSCIEGACTEAGSTGGDTGSNPDVGGGGSTSNCTSDNDCSYGRCDVASGYCVDCLSDVDCPGNYVCQDMICIDAASAGGGSGGGGLPGMGDLGDLLGGGGDTSCTSQADCDSSCTVCNLETNLCEACSDTLACEGGLTCADPGAALGFSIGNLCIADANDPTSALSCLGAGAGGLPGLPGN